MRILILGTNYSALKFRDLFQKNPANDVFSLISKSKNYIDFKLNSDIVEFCTANDINLVVVTEEKYIVSYLTEKLNENNIAVFSPSLEASEIVLSKVYAKRFMYRYQIPAPKFFITEKIQAAIDYINDTLLPAAIKPDCHSFQEGVIFCETKKDAFRAVEKFFSTGNQKIVLEDYIEGRNITVWTISDGYKAKIIGINAKYQNNISYSKPNLLDEETITKITKKIIQPAIDALVEENKEYVGILGFDIIINKAGIPFLIGFDSFFDDISVDFFVENESFNFEDIFISTIEGSIFLKDILPENTYHMLNLRNKTNTGFEAEFNLIKAKTKTNLLRILNEFDYDKKELHEAKLIWEI